MGEAATGILSIVVTFQRLLLGWCWRSGGR